MFGELQKSDFNTSSGILLADVRKLNRRQNLAYKIAENHFRKNILTPLAIMITGQRGSGKSFIINALRQLMHSYCKISSYFGTATFNINGIT